MKILVAVDGSPHALRTLEGLVQRLAWFRETPRITLLYVHPPLPYKGPAASWVGKEALQKYYDDESASALAASRAFLEQHGVAYVTDSKVGDPAHEIVNYATSQGCDVIVCGTHGHTALVNMVMGSVTTKLIASSTVPVLLIR